MSIPPKQFVMRHVFEDVSNMADMEIKYSEEEEHFYIPWKLRLERDINTNGGWIKLECCMPQQKEFWMIATEFMLKKICEDGNPKEWKSQKIEHAFIKNIQSKLSYGVPFDWERFEKNFVHKGRVEFEVHVRILREVGIKKKKLIDFGEPSKEFSDAVLFVEREKFYVSSLNLKLHTAFFKELFEGKQFNGPKKLGFILVDVEVDDLQNFLELLNGVDSLDDATFDGILHLANKYGDPVAQLRCEQFLDDKSKKSLSEKLAVSIKYTFLRRSMRKILAKVRDVYDIRAVLPRNLEDLDKSVLALLMRKLLTLQNE